MCKYFVITQSIRHVQWNHIENNIEKKTFNITENVWKIWWNTIQAEKKTMQFHDKWEMEQFVRWKGFGCFILQRSHSILLCITILFVKQCRHEKMNKQKNNCHTSHTIPFVAKWSNNRRDQVSNAIYDRFDHYYSAEPHYALKTNHSTVSSRPRCWKFSAIIVQYFAWNATNKSLQLRITIILKCSQRK